MRKFLAMLCAVALLLTLVPVMVFAEGESVEFTVLSTTDMHGKCWDTNVLTEAAEPNNMLRVSTAVSKFRETYGDNVLVVDNGDLYQGTPVSVVQLNKITSGESDLPAAMALCLAEIGYDVSVLGNHEFNYSWNTMSSIYDYLDGEGVPVITANLYYDGTDGTHAAGTNVFTPYLIKTFKIGDTEHKIGVLGFENTDCTRWDVPDNYPGIVFAHPDNAEMSMAWEAQRYIPEMQAAGCEFIIVSYHSGLGSAGGDLEFGKNTEGQVARMVAECEGIDMVIAGHDHSSSYSNTFLKDKNGKQVLVVNGGGQQLTQTTISFTEAEGKLAYTLKEYKNLNLGSYAVDTALKEKLQPYADMAIEYVNQAAGTAVGTWDTSSNYYLQQTDTMDLINGAQIDYGTDYMAKKYDTEEKKAELFAKTGLDHIDVDMSSTSAVTQNNYYVRPGAITMKTICQMYKYDNNILYLLALTGQQIKDILEQNAETRLKATVKNGNVTYSTIGEDFTNPVFGGLNFTYDMYQPAGSRAVITGFANGRAFDLEKTYIVACNSYHLGNPGCGFGNYTTEDGIWSQADDLAGGNVQEVLLEYIQKHGEISTEPFTWSWKLDYTGDLDAPMELTGDVFGKKTDAFHDGDKVLIYYEAEGTTLGLELAENTARLSAVDAVVVGDYLGTGSAAAVLTVAAADEEKGYFTLQSEKGYLTSGEAGNSLTYTEEASELSQWYLKETAGGFHIMNVGAAYNDIHNQALEWYTGFTTYGERETAVFLFNVYSLVETASPVEELKDGGTYAIFFDEEETCISTEASNGGLAPVVNTYVGGKLILPLDEKTLVVTAKIAEDGKIDFVTEDGLHLTTAEAGNTLALTEELAANDCSLWTLTKVTNGWHVMNVGAAYNGNHNQALEYYSGKFTTYGVRDTGAYLFNFYELAEGVTNPCAEGHSFVEGDTLVSGTTRIEIAKLFYQAAGKPVVTEPLECIDLDLIPEADRDAAAWAVQNSVLGLIFGNEFGPNEIVTRAMFAAVLYNLAGKPEVTGELASVIDVHEENWFYKAVVWASQQDWIDCNPDGEFFYPDRPLVQAKLTLFACSECGETKWNVSMEQPHDWDSGTVVIAPTMTKEGEIKYRCVNCGAERTEVIPKLMDNYYQQIYQVPEDWSGEYIIGAYMLAYDPTYDEVYITGYDVLHTSLLNVDGDLEKLVLDFERHLARLYSPTIAPVYEFTKTEDGDYLLRAKMTGEYCGCVNGLFKTVSEQSNMEDDPDFRWKVHLDENGNYYLCHEDGDHVYALYYDYNKNFFATVDLNNEAALDAVEGMFVILFRNGDPCANFNDITPTSWYHEAVDFCIEEGLFSGTSDTTFEPDTVMSRAMLVSLLYRLEGSPEFETDKTFTDVPDTWYTKAVLWAAENGIVAGKGDGTFDPNGQVTREQFAAFLYRYAAYKGCDVTARADLSAFPDEASVGTWAKENLSWANAEGLISGALVGNVAYLQPQGGATRSQGASILMRFIQNVIRK